MKTIFHSLMDLLYPRLCVVCECSLNTGEKFFCTPCLMDFPFSGDTFAVDAEVLDNFDEMIRPEACYSLFFYNKYSNYRHLIYAVKYHSRKELGVYLGRMLGERITGAPAIDAIIPIPLHHKREKQRGFNQSVQIALGMAEVMGIEVWEDVVLRVRNNVTQTGKSVEERHENVADIFELCNPSKIHGRHILVVDDVITTGATVGSCLKVLARAGDVRFSLACLAQTKS